MGVGLIAKYGNILPFKWSLDLRNGALGHSPLVEGCRFNGVVFLPTKCTICKVYNHSKGTDCRWHFHFLLSYNSSSFLPNSFRITCPILGHIPKYCSSNAQGLFKCFAGIVIEKIRNNNGIIKL